MKNYPTEHLKNTEYLGSNKDFDFYIWDEGILISPTIQYGPKESNYATACLTKEEFDNKVKYYYDKFQTKDNDTLRKAKIFVVIETVMICILNSVKV